MTEASKWTQCSSSEPPSLNDGSQKTPCLNTPDSEAFLTSLKGPAFLASLFASLFAILLALSWRKWPDFLIDFGRELYIPWQLSLGRVLFVDVADLFGPLSQYWNALWFKLFGVSLNTLMVSNLLIVLVLTYLIYDLFFRACDRSTSILVSSTFLILFAFGHITSVGNYNFVCPYSHEATHGIFLSTAMLWSLSRYAERLRSYWCFLSGGLLGLVFLTKPEVFLAGVTAAGAAFLLLYLSQAHGRLRLRSDLMWFGVSF